jgi:hypothetical protein
MEEERAMTYRGRVKNGTVVLDPPAELPEGASVEVSVIAAGEQQPPPVKSIDDLRGADPGDDPFGEGFEETIRRWRNEPWRSSPQEPLE